MPPRFGPPPSEDSDADGPLPAEPDDALRPARRVRLPPPSDRAVFDRPVAPPPSDVLAPAAGVATPSFRRIGDSSTGLTPIRTRAQMTRRTAVNRDDLLIFGVSFLVALGIAVAIYYGLDIWNADSLSRTIDAQAVLYSRDPHLGAIGFVWPPLPTLSRIAILPLTQNLGIAEFTGQITSALFAAGCVVVLYRILCRLELPKNVRIVWLGVAMLNPVVVLHFANGTAESAFTLLLLILFHAALRLPVAPLPAISGMGLAIAAALLVRYEALAIGGTAAVGVLLYAEISRRTSRGPVRQRTEALLVALLFPIVFVGLMWLYFNWSIQGDPLFFYRSVYSIRGAADVARNAPGHVLEYAVHSIPGTMRYVTERTLQVSALFIPAVAYLGWAAWRKRDPIALLILMVSLSIHAMQAYQAFTGSIAPWLRYWVYLPLLTPILLGYVMAQPGWGSILGPRGRSAVLFGLVPALFMLTNATAFLSMRSAEVGYDEQIFAHSLLGDMESAERVRAKIPSKDSAEEIAAYLNTTEGTVLLDKQRAPLFILSIDDPSRLIIDSDRTFLDDIADAPNVADWVLLPDPSEDTEAVFAHDSVYMVYPDLYDGAPWLELDHEFTGNKHWRLYRVVPVPEDAPAED